MIRRALIVMVKAYRLLLSPTLGGACRFEPTCSLYAIEALERHGAARGSVLTLYRLVRCQPWCQGGHDPVPPNKPGKSGGRTLFSSLLSDKNPSS